MKTLLSTLILGAGLVFNSCDNSKELENQSELKKVQTELEKYNLENKQVYEDFKKFCKENPDKKICLDSTYKIKLNNGTDIRFSKGGFYLSISAKDTTFFDDEMDGCNSYVFKDKKDSQLKVKSMQNLSAEEQLKVDKQYTDILKQILSDAGVSGY